MLLGATHGILYGVLYAPAQALFFKMDLQMTVAWIISGAPFDILHAIGNLAACTLVCPLTRLLLRLEKQSKH
jgi:energy-coupling factor transport system substrate-specific component